MSNRLQVELTKSFGGSWYKGAKKHLRREYALELIARGDAIAIIVLAPDSTHQGVGPSEIKVVEASGKKSRATRKAKVVKENGK